jgi:hypothetical protein
MPAWFWGAVGGFLLLAAVIGVVWWIVTVRRTVQPALPVGSEAQRPLSNLVDEEVQFTVYRPRAVEPERWYTLIAFAHLAAKRADAPAEEPDPVAEVKQQAMQVLGERQTPEYRAVTQDASQPVPREETLTFVPTVPGVEFNPPVRSFRWTESVHREEFRFRAEHSLAGQSARGRLSVFLGDVLLADVSLTIPVGQRGSSRGDDAPAEAERARPYRKIFASYSHKDSHVVEQIECLARALGDEYLRDCKHLRAGEAWDDRLLELIEAADVFQLFWSRHAMDSPYVQREYEYALSLNRPYFVRPTFWEEPLPEDPGRKLPPEALLRLHFQRIGPFLLPGVSRSASTPAFERDEGGKDEILGYELVPHLGRGGIGSVLLGKDRKTGLRVAMKRAPLEDRPNVVCGPVVPLRHPGIVPILAVGEVGDWLWTVMPCLEGGTLADHLRVKGLLSVREAVEVVQSLAEAVHYAHSWGVYHLNLKPSKVLFDGSGRPALIGFHELRLREGAAYGTPVYMAPEQADGDLASIGPMTDVYGLGVILYECLTGQRPFKGESIMDLLEQVRSQEPVPPRRLQPKVPRDLEAICLKCLQKAPSGRYASCRDLADDLRRFRQGEPIPCRPRSISEQCFRYLLRHRRLAAVVALALVSLLSAVLWLFLQYVAVR